MKKLFVLCALLVSATLASADMVREISYVGTNGYIVVTNKVPATCNVRYTGFGINSSHALGTNFSIYLTSATGYTNLMYSGFSFTSTVYYAAAETVPLTYADVVRINFGINLAPALNYTNKFRFFEVLVTDK